MSDVITPCAQGILLPLACAQDAAQCQSLLQDLSLTQHVCCQPVSWDGQQWQQFRATDAFRDTVAPGLDTTRLCAALGLTPDDSDQDLQREILLSMLLGPVPFAYPTFQELAAALQIRMRIVRNAARTVLAFDTEQAERPDAFWRYDPQTSFILKPGVSLIDALQETTQPAQAGVRYSFSCYRATEYVLLLSIAQVLAQVDAPRYAQLQHQWRTRAIMSGLFHEVFLLEYGSMTQPLPLRYYVPGDRLWFRNPDQASSDAEGYEGSWVFYLGQGLFTNFWKQDQPFTLESKCLELFHWRHATYRGSDGKLKVDDDEVDRLVAQSAQDEAQRQAIVTEMLRWRDASGVYADGGCIDTTRECVRRVCPQTSELAFPDAA